MTTPLTYVWFYELVRNGGQWDYKQKNVYGLISEISITGQLVMPLVFLQRCYIWQLAPLNGARAHLIQHGEMFSKGHLSVMTRWINSGKKQGIDYVKQHHF